jgi:AbrB family looped-hinge helix DNA binding protein
MKVTTKGQVTIPQEIRERLGLKPGAEVEFTIDGKGARMVPVKRDRLHGRRIVARLRGKGTIKLTTDEIMAMTRGE